MVAFWDEEDIERPIKSLKSSAATRFGPLSITTEPNWVDVVDAMMQELATNPRMRIFRYLVEAIKSPICAPNMI